MTFFSIGYPDQERVEIKLLGSPANKATDGYDWIKAIVCIYVGCFTGEVKISMCLSDMIRFKEQLETVYHKLKGTAEFTTLEGQFYAQIEVDSLGHVLASGYLVDNFAGGNKLSFEICYDQTLLWHTISEIDEALFELSHGPA